MTDGGENETIPKTINVDGDTSPRKLAELLRWDSELDELDYKGDCNLSITRDQLELVRDIVAMANTRGGYIVVGVVEEKASTPRFRPKGMHLESLRSFDQSTIRSHLENHVHEPVQLTLTTLDSPEHPGLIFGLVFVRRSELTPLVFARDGQYPDPRDNKRSASVFREGDVFVRRNTSSIRANRSDWYRLISDIRIRERLQWTDEVLHITGLTKGLDRLLQQFEHGQLSQPLGGPDETTFLLGTEQFGEKFRQVLAAGNDIVSRQWLDFGVSLFRRHLASSMDKEAPELAALRDNYLIPILDALLVASWLLLRNDQISLLEESISAFHQIYNLPADTPMGESRDPQVHFSHSLVWKLVIERIYLLGGLAVIHKRFAYVPALVQRSPDTDPFWRKSFWARHTLTILARERHLSSGSLCQLSLTDGQANPYIWEFFNSTDKATNAVCQFDFLQNVLAATENHDLGDTYPSFGAYYNQHTEPIISDLVINGPSRQALPGISDGDLAWAIRQLDALAAREFFRSATWYRGYWTDDRIVAFLAANPEQREGAD